MSEYKRNPRGARRARKSMGRKAIVVLSLMMVLVLAAVGGTIAWLTSKTNPVTNTFTTAGVEITLIETKKPNGGIEYEEDGTAKAVTNWEAQLIPGNSYAKNPTVIVEDTTDVPIWLFVKFEENNVTYDSNYLHYTSTLNKANGWTQGLGTDNIPTNVWYREVDPTAPNAVLSWVLLEQDENGMAVHVPDTLTNKDMPEDDFSLVYTAYACQKDNRTAVEAWQTLNPPATTD